MPSSSNPLDIRTCTKQVLEALVEVLDLGLGLRAPEAADLAALESYEWENLADRSLVFCVSEGVVFRWLAASLLTPAPPYVIAPQNLPEEGNGRFVRTTSSVTFGPAYFRPLHRVRTGFAKVVQIYEGEDDEQLERIYGQRPAYLIEWIEDSLAVKSYQHGAIYDVTLKFSLHALAQNLRENAEALVGSDVPGDEGPGLLYMIGIARYLLGGCELGLAPGVKFTDVTGAARIVESDLAQRVFRAELDVTVQASVHVVDEDLEPNPEVWIERRDAGTPPGEEFDASNYLVRGYQFSPVAGLSGTPTSGLAYLAGQLIQSAPGAYLFPANADTYRDLGRDGALFYFSVPIGADAPPQRPNTLRIGVTRTDSTRIVADTVICSYSVPSGADPGDPFRAA